jgi:hypothetical protein
MASILSYQFAQMGKFLWVEDVNPTLLGSVLWLYEDGPHSQLSGCSVWVSSCFSYSKW